MSSIYDKWDKESDGILGEGFSEWEASDVFLSVLWHGVHPMGRQTVCSLGAGWLGQVCSDHGADLRRRAGPNS